MTTTPTILVPIRYPLTVHTTNTLEQANRLAEQYDDAHIVVLHVNLYHTKAKARERDIRRRVAPFFPDHEFLTITRRGFFVEEVIATEADQYDVDFVVLGKNRTSAWRRFISRILGDNPAIASYLQAQTDASVEVVS